MAASRIPLFGRVPGEIGVIISSSMSGDLYRVRLFAILLPVILFQAIYPGQRRELADDERTRLIGSDGKHPDRSFS